VKRRPTKEQGFFYDSKRAKSISNVKKRGKKKKKGARKPVVESLTTPAASV